MLQKIAFLGLGAMGSRMAQRLANAGHALTVWNRTPPAPAQWADARIADTPRKAATGADIVFTMVRDDEAARAVWLDPATGALAAMKPGALAIDCSTVSQAFAGALNIACASAGVDCLDAPVLGSRPQAEGGALIFLAGGEAATLDRARSVLAALGGGVHHLGPSGSGAAAKLILNALFGIQVTAIAELLGLAARMGLARADIAAVIAETPVASPAMKGAMSSMIGNAFAPMFPVDLVAKDFGLIADAATAASSAIPLASAARAVFDNALAHNLGEHNLTAVAKLYP